MENNNKNPMSLFLKRLVNGLLKYSWECFARFTVQTPFSDKCKTLNITSLAISTVGKMHILI